MALADSGAAWSLTGWGVAESEPGSVDGPRACGGLRWIEADEACTVAAALRTSGVDLFAASKDLDASDWWYRTRFARPRVPGRRVVLRFDGIAGIADVWMNGERILRTSNAFVAHEIDVTLLVRDDNELVVRLAAIAAQRRPGSRPRWKSGLVPNQHLRHVRVPLFGRMPGWCPPVAVLGLTGPVRLLVDPLFERDPAVVARVVDGAGVVDFDAVLGVRADRAWLVVGDVKIALDVEPAAGGGARVRGSLTVERPALWWPHTHGEQPLYDVTFEVDAAGERRTIPLRRIGFRTIEVAEPEGAFAFVWNGVRMFARGTVWTPLDAVSLRAEERTLRAALLQCRDAGMNMLRVAAIGAYESETFHDLCDELGVAVWQDAMFATMDYPADDEAFVASVREESRQLGVRLSGRPSIALVAGNCEVAQRAALMGLERAHHSSVLFDRVLPESLARALPDVPYLPSTPWGGAMPFHPDAGVAHWFGVGAYLRDFADTRAADVKFASECLAFANVPEQETIDRFLRDGESVGAHPAWKARVPRDRGVSWDFEDVRDHYVRALFGVDPARLRFGDTDRYLALGRVATGEAMARVFSEWRRAGSGCSGGIVLMNHDPWPGAGWGVVDALGRRKAAWFHLKRVLQPLALLVTDEGLGGLALHVVNDTAAAREVDVSLVVLRDGETVIAEGGTTLTAPARDAVRLSGDALIGRFTDLCHAYRFGPPGHDASVARLRDRTTGELLAEQVHFPLGAPDLVGRDVGLHAQASPMDGERWRLAITARRLARWVHVEAPGHVVSDDYFHVTPGIVREVTLCPDKSSGSPPSHWRVAALNGTTPARPAWRA